MSTPTSPATPIPATPTFPAFRFDGRDAKAVPVVLRIDDGDLVVATTDGSVLERERLDRVIGSEPLDHAPRLITLPRGAIFEVPDADRSFTRELRSTGLRLPLAIRLQRQWPGVLAAAAILVALLAAGYLKGLPLAAHWGAFALPPQIETRMRGILRYVPARALLETDDSLDASKPADGRPR